MVKRIKRQKKQAWEERRELGQLYHEGLQVNISEITKHHEKVHRALGKKVFSFDLHGTLLLPKKPMEDYVLDQFRTVMKRHGIDLLRDFSSVGKEFAERLKTPPEKIDNGFIRVLTEYYLGSIIQTDSRKYKSALNKLAEGRCTELKRDKRLKMGIVNAMVISETMGYTDISPEQLDVMAEGIHQQIDAFGDEWMIGPQTAVLLDHVTSLNPCPTICILSNTKYPAAERAVKQYLSRWFAPWMIFTPEVLGGYLKPSAEAYIGAMVGARCGIVREIVEGRPVDLELAVRVSEAMKGCQFGVQRWERARSIAIESSQKSIAADKRLGVESIYAGIGIFVEQLGLPPALRNTLGMRYEQFHYVGNSELHDTVPRMNMTDGLLERLYNRLLGIRGYEKLGTNEQKRDN